MLMISGDYCSFHEMSFNVVYDITNDEQLEDYTLDELKKWKYEDYSDVQEVDAIKDGDKYYCNL